jgi:ABC-type transport system involved in multi-copper enzyme maturation permease subunit
MSRAASEVPSTGSSVATLAAITFKRLTRGKALWIGALIAALPLIYASVVKAGHGSASAGDLFRLPVLLLVLLPAMFVSASIGEEIEDRTSTYLWSRPIARWAVLAGKLSALVPVVIALIVGGWVVASEGWSGAAPSLRSCAALGAASVASALVAAGIATIVPRHGMAMTIGYMLVDTFIGALPFSLRELSISHQADVLANLDGGSPGIATPLVAMLVVSGLWAAIALSRIRRLEV